MASQTSSKPAPPRAASAGKAKLAAARSVNGKPKSKPSSGKQTTRGKASAKTDGKQTLPTIGEYLIERLRAIGVDDVFGIPGDYTLGFYEMLEESPIDVIGCTREDNAGYAADAYARVHGIGAVCVTYCVGGLSVCNSVAGMFSEKSPVVVITGAPGMEERRNDPLLHHRVRDFSTQREIFEKITVASTALEDPLTAFREIDRVLDAVQRYKRPVYIEIPRDRVHVRALMPHTPMPVTPTSNDDALKAAVKAAAEKINAAKQPVILGGVEVHRFGLREQLLTLAEDHNIPFSTTLLGKSVLSEKHPLALGVYEGAMGRDGVRKYVEESDCVIMLGAFMTDINLGIYTASLEVANAVNATSEKLSVGHSSFNDVLFGDFLEGLAKADLKSRKKPNLPKRESLPKPQPKSADGDAVTIATLFSELDHALEEENVVVADVGDSLFAAADLTIHKHTEFLSPAYYTSMGFAIPASVGVQTADRSKRPVVLVGDGAFQMTCLELSTSIRQSFNPIVIVLNNKGYTTERYILDGAFNDILNWQYHRIPDLLGAGWGFEVRTHGELRKSLKAASENDNAFSILNVHLDPWDTSPALKRLGERMGKNLEK